MNTLPANILRKVVAPLHDEREIIMNNVTFLFVKVTCVIKYLSVGAKKEIQKNEIEQILYETDVFENKS